MKEYIGNLILVVGILTCVWACTPEEELFTDDPAAQLSFSENAVVFDTIYTALPSITRWLTVYNPNKRAVRIGDVYLGNQVDSPYEVIINGRPLENAKNLRLLGGDSLLVLVKASILPHNESLPFVIYDSLMFQVNGNLQNVKLLAWGQDVNFIKYTDSIPSCNTTWTATKPYILMDSVRVPASCQLTLEAGTQVYARPNAAIIVEGTLIVNGTPEKPVIFADYRQSKDNVPGQWRGIVYKKSSQNNEIKYAQIRNADIGLDIEIADEDAITDVGVENTVIKNMLSAGIRTLNSDVSLTNTLLTNGAATLVDVRGGGNYTFTHCTLANYSYDFARQLPAVLMSNNYKNMEENISITRPLSWTLLNSTIWGNYPEEIWLDRQPSVSFTIQAANNVLKTGLMDFFTGNNNLLNVPPKPLFTEPERLNFRPDSLSPLINAASPSAILTDITGKKRDGKPDVGAYER